MEKVRPWCGQPSDRGRLKNRTERHVTLTFDLLTFNSWRAWRVTWLTLPPSLNTLCLYVFDLWVITFPFGYHWECVRGQCACAESRDPWVGGRNNYIFGIPDHDLPIHYKTFIGLRRRLRVVYSRAVPCKPFSGHFMQIIRWKLKIRLGNRAHRIQHASIMLKNRVPHFYPKMHLDDYWRPLFRNPSSLYYRPKSCVIHK